MSPAHNSSAMQFLPLAFSSFDCFWCSLCQCILLSTLIRGSIVPARPLKSHVNERGKGEEHQSPLQSSSCAKAPRTMALATTRMMTIITCTLSRLRREHNVSLWSFFHSLLGWCTMSRLLCTTSCNVGSVYLRRKTGIPRQAIRWRGQRRRLSSRHGKTRSRRSLEPSPAPRSRCPAPSLSIVVKSSRRDTLNGPKSDWLCSERREAPPESTLSLSSTLRRSTMPFVNKTIRQMRNTQQHMFTSRKKTANTNEGRVGLACKPFRLS